MERSRRAADAGDEDEKKGARSGTSIDADQHE